MTDRPVFECTMCGQCCEGEGGIILGPRDLERISRGLELDPKTFLVRYGVKRNGKWQIRTGNDGKCIFFRAETGCSVHPVRPDVCRAWPFFRGNMVDAESLYLAKEYCPGIRSDATFEEFTAEGREYLQQNGLVASDPKTEGHALLPPSSSKTSF